MVGGEWGPVSKLWGSSLTAPRQLVLWNPDLEVEGESEERCELFGWRR